MTGHVYTNCIIGYHLLQSHIHNHFSWHDKGSQSERVVPRGDCDAYRNKMNLFQNKNYDFGMHSEFL